ncbi:MAG: hypothetical protein JKY31_07895 [Rhodobacteraceae bacterium]|nr:hypothetical protein [Paracoccaceae bacterium]
MSKAKKIPPPLLRFRIWRGPLRRLRLWRIFSGGRINDFGRLPRYFLAVTIVFSLIWAAIFSYLKFTPPSYISKVSLILPGSGAAHSITLETLGQASSFANSAFSSPSISPTQTYKRLLSANRVLVATAQSLGVELSDIGRPQISLIDETSLIHFEMQGASPAIAQATAQELLRCFQHELTILRADDLNFRQKTAAAANQEYAGNVQALRREITVIQQASGLISFAQYQQLVSETDTIQASLHAAIAQLRSAEQAVAALSQQIGVDIGMAALILKLHSNTHFRGLAQAVTDQAVLLANANGKYGAEHPVVRHHQAALAGAGQALLNTAADLLYTSPQVLRGGARHLLYSDNSGLLSALQHLSVEMQTQQAVVNSYITTLTNTRMKLDAMAPYAALLDDLERDYQVAEMVFASAMARSDTSKSDIYASYPLVQVLEDASLPLRASSPNRLVAILAGIGANVMFIIALVLAWVRRPIIAKIINKRGGVCP